MARLSPDSPHFENGSIVSDSRFGSWCAIGAGSVITDSSLGDYSYCGRLCDIANAAIGKFASIASMVRIGPTDHPFGHAAQHHFHYRSSDYWDDAGDDAAFFDKRRSRRVETGHDIWIGHGAIIKPELRLGHGVIVAAGAVVTRSVDPFMIVAGVPAVPIRARFPPKISERLMALAWWDWDHARLREALKDFRSLDAEAFLEKHHG